MTIDFEIPSELRELESSLRRFAIDQLRPGMREAEADHSWPPSWVKALDGFGVPGLDLPLELGGEGAGSLAKAIALEALAWGDAGGLPAADFGPSAAAVAACPDTDLAHEVATATLRHEAASLIAIDPAIEAGTVSTLHWAPGWPPGRWLWVSAGIHLRCYDVERCPIEEAPAAAFDASGGVTFSRRGTLAVDEWELEPEEAMTLRGRARLWPAAVSVGVADAALGFAMGYATDRVVAGKPVAHHQANAFAIAEAAARVDGARLAVRSAAASLDAGTPGAGGDASLAYLEAVDAAPVVCDLALQLLGGHGYVEDNPVEKWFREARMLAQLWGGREAAITDAGTVFDRPDPLLGSA